MLHSVLLMSKLLGDMMVDWIERFLVSKFDSPRCVCAHRVCALLITWHFPPELQVRNYAESK